MNKITSILALTGVAATLSSCQGNRAAHTQNERPNIVFIMSDDHAWQAISAYGHPIGQVAPTPNIDRIAKHGMLFTNNFCANSICGPSRATIITGKFSHINGFTHNGKKFDGSQPTFPKILHKNGYQTALIGKWHLAGEPTGFDYWKILNDQGSYYNPDFITKEDTVRETGYATDLITDYTLNWLKEKRDKSKPFCLMMQHKAPHRNWMPALRHINRYDHVKFPVPSNYFDDYKGRQAAAEQEMNIYRDMYEGHDLKMSVAKGSDSLRYNRWPGEFTRMNHRQDSIWKAAYRPKNDAFYDAHLDKKGIDLWKYQRYMQDYMACIASVDESVGKILDYLKANGLDKNTIVVYTSDQGFYLGEHGWFDKRFMYEESFRMPLIVSYPGHIPEGSISNDLTQNIDFAETFLDFAGLDVPNDMQGRSLRPVLEGRSPDNWRKSLYYHYYEYPAFHMVKRHYGIRTERYKLIHFYNDIDKWELYDLELDPHEMNNLIDDPEYDHVEAELRIQLKDLMDKYKEPPYDTWKDEVIHAGR
ncbi:sulfatase [Saccharicrinis sp. FJH54]|uniref:sulfatase family protein n=1 Tax=Saccharicrinis sp. FJH54 TaxID=3344665 RepID=UPI0035D4528D